MKSNDRIHRKLAPPAPPAPLARPGSIAVVGLVVGLWILTALVGPAIGDDEPKKVNPKTWHASSFGSGRGGYRILHAWSKGPNLRSETLIAGHPVITIVRGNRYIVVDTLLGKGVDIERAPAAIADDKKGERPFANEFEVLVRENGEKVDDEVVLGVKTEVWRSTDSAGRRTIWVKASEPKVPVRIESFDRAIGNTVTIDYSNWMFDLRIPDDFFLLPAGLKLETLSYDDYVARSLAGAPDPAPIFHPQLLHGARSR
jgi:outer membrane lipoprotein-sorting protein